MANRKRPPGTALVCSIQFKITKADHAELTQFADEAAAATGVLPPPAMTATSYSRQIVLAHLADERKRKAKNEADRKRRANDAEDPEAKKPARK